MIIVDLLLFLFTFQELSERLNAEKQLEIVKRKEKTESHLYMTLRILFEDSFYGHQGNDLYEVDKQSYQEVNKFYIHHNVVFMLISGHFFCHFSNWF